MMGHIDLSLSAMRKNNGESRFLKKASFGWVDLSAFPSMQIGLKRLFKFSHSPFTSRDGLDVSEA